MSSTTGPEPAADPPPAKDVDAYLEAKAWAWSTTTTVDALPRIHRAQVERVPYETRGSTTASAGRSTRRGGAAHRPQPARRVLLPPQRRAQRGPRRPRVPGGASRRWRPRAGRPRCRRRSGTTSAHRPGLTDRGNPSGRWYVDAGLGDGLHEPLPLVAGTYLAGSVPVRAGETAGGVGDWHLTHDPAGGFTGMACAAPPSAGSVRRPPRELSTSPDSGFVRVLTAQRRWTRPGSTSSAGCVLTRRSGDALATETITDQDAWFEALGGVCGLPLRLTDLARDALWASVLAGHQRWLESQEQ